ncbi:unnamed protein product [Ilex paraguariensis]|uniref:Uncharacterized protein n=1 Tax=Ilex paraguariensis TaxID=185542 RepID=A0ABC8V0L4_9AQUA
MERSSVMTNESPADNRKGVQATEVPENGPAHQISYELKEDLSVPQHDEDNPSSSVTNHLPRRRVHIAVMVL